MRRKTKRKKINTFDTLYDNQMIGKFINYIMRKGKKSVAEKVVYKSFEIIKEKTKNRIRHKPEIVVDNVLINIKI